MRAFGKDWKPASYRAAIERALDVPLEDDADDERE